MFRRGKKPDILNGNIVPTLFLIGWPIMIESLLQISYNLADTYWLGNMGETAGKEALAATQVSWPLVWLMVSVGTGFGIAAIALISQHTGAKQHGIAELIAGQLFFFMIIFSTIVAIVGFLISPLLLNSILVDSPEVAAKGTVFMRTIFLSQPFMFIFMAFAFTLRAWGDTITPMMITVVAVGANIILDPLFIYGVGPFPKWGIFGAAFATLITRAFAASIAMYLILKGKLGIKLSLENLKPDFYRLKKLFKIGAPASIGNSGTAFGFVAIMFIVARVHNSDAALAAYNAGDRILGVMFVLMGGLAIAMSTMVGQNLGAGKLKRAQEVVKKGMISIAGLMGVFTIILFLLSREFIIIFNQDPEVVRMGAEFLLIFSLSMPFFGLFRAVNAVFEGSGHTKYMMGLDLLRLWGLRVPLSFIFALYLGMQSTGVWIGMALSNVLSAGAAILVLGMGRWKTKVIDDEVLERPKNRI
ncbi:MAG: MATE family efflux transporter [Thermoplasmata archaeon]